MYTHILYTHLHKHIDSCHLHSLRTHTHTHIFMYAYVHARTRKHTHMNRQSLVTCILWGLMYTCAPTYVPMRPKVAASCLLCPRSVIFTTPDWLKSTFPGCIACMSECWFSRYILLCVRVKERCGTCSQDTTRTRRAYTCRENMPVKRKLDTAFNVWAVRLFFF